MSAPQPAPSLPPAEVRQIAMGCLIGGVLGLGAFGLLFLWALNHRKSITVKGEEPEEHGWKKWVKFFFKDILLELVSLMYGFFFITYIK